MKTRTYYVVQIRIGGCAPSCRGFLAYRDREFTAYSVRAIPGKWYRTDLRHDARMFQTPGKARCIARRLKLVKKIIQYGGAWEIVKISEEVVESSDEAPLLRLARCAR